MISDSSINAIRKFVAERDWSQFHTPGNLAKSISIEAAELLECFQWNDEPQDSNIEHIHEEIADVLIYCIMLSDKFGFDLDEIILDKLAKNAQRYPVEFAYGQSHGSSVGMTYDHTKGLLNFPSKVKATIYDAKNL